jgi:hypothetical protein
MLLVGEMWDERDRRFAHHLHEAVLDDCGFLHVAGMDLPQLALQEAPDSRPDHRVGHQSCFCPVDGFCGYAAHACAPKMMMGLYEAASLRPTG